MAQRIDKDLWEMAGRVSAKELSETINPHFINLSFDYANTYKTNPKSFVSSFIKYDSIKMACSFIIAAYKYQDALPVGKDFTTYCEKLDLPERWKRVLNINLQIIYSLINETK